MFAATGNVADADDPTTVGAPMSGGAVAEVGAAVPVAPRAVPRRLAVGRGPSARAQPRRDHARARRAASRSPRRSS